MRHRARHTIPRSATVLISPASVGHRFADAKPEDREKSINAYASKVNPVEFLVLSGTSPAALGGESFDHRSEWELYKFAPAMGKRPVLLITANDGTRPNSEALLQALQHGGNTHGKQVEIETDHPFSDHRIELASDIINWLAQQPALQASSRSENTVETGAATSVVSILRDPICQTGHLGCAP